MNERVHLAGPIRPFALCLSTNASERHTRVLGDVNCPFCSALYLADHPEYVLESGDTPGSGKEAAAADLQEKG